MCLDKTKEEILQLIDLRDRDWSENQYTTNCYAYALGLNVAEDEIDEYYSVYQPGVIGSVMSGCSDEEIDRLDEMDIEERLLLDLKALGIKYRRVDQMEPIDYKYIQNELYRWKIALYLRKDLDDEFITDAEPDERFDYHFLRQFENGDWYHKPDAIQLPRKVEKGIDYYKDIKDLDYGRYIDYHYYKSYELTLSRKK